MEEVTTLNQDTNLLVTLRSYLYNLEGNHESLKDALIIWEKSLKEDDFSKKQDILENFDGIILSLKNSNQLKENEHEELNDTLNAIRNIDLNLINDSLFKETLNRVLKEINKNIENGELKFKEPLNPETIKILIQQKSIERKQIIADHPKNTAPNDFFEKFRRLKGLVVPTIEAGFLTTSSFFILRYIMGDDTLSNIFSSLLSLTTTASIQLSSYNRTNRSIFQNIYYISQNIFKKIHELTAINNSQEQEPLVTERANFSGTYGSTSNQLSLRSHTTETLAIENSVTESENGNKMPVPSPATLADEIVAVEEGKKEEGEDLNRLTFN